MKKKVLFVLVCCLSFLFVISARAQEQGLSAVRITYTTEATISQDAAVEAQVTLVYSDQETSFDALLRLNDQSTDLVERMLPQKSLRIDSNDIHFVLHNDGGDALYTKIMSAVCSNLITHGPIVVPMRAQEPVEVYINDEYWGVYTRREVIEEAIARFEGIDDTTTLNVANVHYEAICGNVYSLRQAFDSIKILDLSDERDRQSLNKLLDTESFINWMVVNSYFGNPNLYGELFFYQIDEGPWKCATGDFAYALFTASDNSIARLVKKDASRGDAAVLASKMLKEPVYRDVFLTKLGALYQTIPTSMMQEAVDIENDRIASVLPSHMKRWADTFAQEMSAEFDYPVKDAQEALLFQRFRVYRLRDKTLVRRPYYLYDSVQRELEVSDEEMMHYFGGLRPELPEVPSDTWEDYKVQNR